MKNFKANGVATLIGSFPMDNYKKATELVLEKINDFPLWVQLPVFEKGMVEQFTHGLPGVTKKNDKTFINTLSSEFDKEFLSFFEEYLMVSEGSSNIEKSRFAFNEINGKGFNEFLRQIDSLKSIPTGLKGHVTGPITFGTDLKDQDDKSIFYNEQLKDAAIKHLAMNAKFQAREFSKRGALPVIFIDEPALAGFGTSAYITISKTDVKESIEEIVHAIHQENGLAGVHVCANTEWDILLDSSLDIINFDAYSFFDKFILYPDMIRQFLENKKFLAWGIIPTGKPEWIEKETSQSIADMLNQQIKEIEKLGFDRKTIIEQSFITPSCGTGSLEFRHALKVLELTKDVSKIIRASV